MIFKRLSAADRRVRFLAQQERQRQQIIERREKELVDAELRLIAAQACVTWIKQELAHLNRESTAATKAATKGAK
jgi:hypothetical protein